MRHEARKHERSEVRGVVHVCIPSPGQTVLDLEGPGAFRALIGDVSSGGLSFIHPAELKVDHVIVGVRLSEDDIKWFHAEIMRSREITEADFWEYGVAFATADRGVTETRERKSGVLWLTIAEA